jgi:formate dehydrogenase major subunit
MSHLLPGYLGLPTEKDPDLKSYLEKRTPRPLRPGQMNYWQNYPKFFVSLMKAWYGPAATKENDFCFDWLPKNDKTYDILAAFELMHQGKVSGYVCQGFNPLASVPDKAKLTEALSKLKYLVIIDPLATETSTFWKNHGEFNDVDSSKIQTEVFRLPSTCFAEEDGSLVNSGRWLQWHWKAADPPGEAKGDPEIIAELFLRVRALYAKEGGAFPDPILKLHWPYKIARAPSQEEIAKEFSGYALADVPDPKDPTKFLAREGEQVPGFGALQADGTTACGCWIFSGSWTQAGNQMARRDPADPSGLGNTPGWAWSWPANRRILYNRASADTAGKPWDPNRKFVSWNGKKWGGADVPDIRPDAAPEENVQPFIMNPEGVGRLFALGGWRRGPSRSTTSRSRRRSRRTRSRRRRSPTRRRGSSRATGRSSARQRTTPSSPPPTGSPSTSTSGRSTPASRRCCSPRPSSRSARAWRSSAASRTATRSSSAPSAARSG